MGHNLPAPSRVRGPLVDWSGVIVIAGTAQPQVPQNANRDYLFVQNQHATADLWLNFRQAAIVGQPSIRIPAGAVLVFEGDFIPTGGVSIIGGTTSQPFTLKEG